MHRRKHFFLVSADRQLALDLASLWPEPEVIWSAFTHGAEVLDALFTDPPDLLVVDDPLADMTVAELTRMIKAENVYRQLPVVQCLTSAELAAIRSFTRLEMDDFLVKPLEAFLARARLLLAYYRSTRELDASPLTKLPGNTSITHKIQELIDRQEEFALAYVDLDHFKSFNDRYGFSRGDEVLHMTARVITNSIRGIMETDAFIGHVGGDDFVFIVPASDVERICHQLMANFDSIVPYFYDEQDRLRRSISSLDRRGREQIFPLMSISIAVVINWGAKLRHFGEASQIAMNLKKEAKKNPRSCYVLDKRAT